LSSDTTFKGPDIASQQITRLIEIGGYPYLAGESAKLARLL
jgi:hypothetical protein